jgi:hypothetical protein
MKKIKNILIITLYVVFMTTSCAPRTDKNNDHGHDHGTENHDHNHDHDHTEQEEFVVGDTAGASLQKPHSHNDDHGHKH